MSVEQLNHHSLTVDQTFVDCFNAVSVERRVILCMDTVDELEDTGPWDYITRIAQHLRNAVLLIAGRNARELGEAWQQKLADDVSIIDLSPLDLAISNRYLQLKQEMLRIQLNQELTQKLPLLAGGKPLLIDLALEWQARGIEFPWLIEQQLDELQALPTEQLRERQHEFERLLVVHITETGRSLDWLILVMACVYPLDVETIVKLLGLNDDEARDLFNEIQGYVFVKQMGDQRISLHDEMRRMVNDYVWDEIDPAGNPQRRESRITAEYLEREITVLASRIDQLMAAEKKAGEEANREAALSAFMTREPLEQELWSLKGQYLEHVLFLDVDDGVETFATMFDEASRAYRFHFRGVLLAQVQKYVDQLSIDQHYELISRQIQYFMDEGEYLLARNLVTEMLNGGTLNPERQVQMLIQRANAEIRLGSVDRGITDFETSVAVSQEHNLVQLLIKSSNALGWAYRLIGELDKATSLYRQARALCLDQGSLGDDYGWILNNLTFVLSYRNHRSSIGFGRSAVAYWQSIGNEIGLGAGYLVLGIAYYQKGMYDEALEVFEKALSIFDTLQLEGWIGQIYSWRGAIYQDMGNLTQAASDLRDSLDVSSRNIEAMTLCRLGQVYMAQERWETAEVYLQRSHERAYEIPDFVYWIASLAHLITIAAERQQYDRLEEFENRLQECLNKTRTPDGHAVGIAYFGLARLALGCHQFDLVLRYLEQALALVTIHGSYARVDVLDELNRVERDFANLDISIVHSIGEQMKEIMRTKEVEDIDYGLITPIMYTWATWTP
ncbi:MAG: tetratricopeptide repeat protein [Chloroflexaceae bacterium]|nr:tetratricopeptide repeat protein [Chloroflexaceae bacterium]